MLNRLFRRFTTELHESYAASGRSMVIAGAVGALVFIGYGVLWLFVRPVEHESLALRSIAVVLCVAAALGPRWPERLKPLLPWVCFVAVMYALPMFATYQLIGSNYGVLRSMLMVSMVFFVIVIFPYYLLALANIIIGIALGTLAAWATIDEFASLNHAIVKSVHVQAMIYSVAAGLLFTRSNLKAMLARQRADTLQALAGSIAHELRNPLGQLRHRLRSIARSLPRPIVSGVAPTLSARELDSIYAELAQGRLAIERGLQMISMTLDEIQGKSLATADLQLLSAAAVTGKAVDEFGYESEGDRARVELHVVEDFVFRGDETHFVFVLFNLLKNALHYFPEYPQARVRILVERQWITFEDTGPGMTPQVRARVFEAFHTAGKEGGTGLGLSFCKRAMAAFGGEITCDSEPNRFTRFFLRLPVVSQAEVNAREARTLKRARRVLKGKRALVVDDVAALRTIARAMLEPLGLEVEEAEHGKAALEILGRGRFDAMVLDLSMPVMDGYATAEAIRNGRASGHTAMPIVVYTSESARSARAKLERVGVDEFIRKPCTQVELASALCRACEREGRVKEADNAAATLEGRTILVVEDEVFSRRYLRVLLEERGVKVLEAVDGAAALEQLQGVVVDAVITDLHMPRLDGIGLAQAVRDSALARKPPILALSARDDAGPVAAARAAGIFELVTKPAEPDELFPALARMLKGSAAIVPAAAAAPAKGDEILNAARLESLRKHGILEEAVPGAMRSARSLLDSLPGPIAARDHEATTEQLHALVGVYANIGAHALHRRLRFLHVDLLENDEWPGPQWHQELLELHAATAEALREQYLPQFGDLSGR
ncbi:MAG: hybrid sensor histidine kinase/response regulator [Ramlibacter sp.]